jgi:hypothetical protein
MEIRLFQLMHLAALLKTACRNGAERTVVLEKQANLQGFGRSTFRLQHHTTEKFC